MEHLADEREEPEHEDCRDTLRAHRGRVPTLCD
jgi:hypothetical protein